MAITTTESIKRKPADICARCGWPIEGAAEVRGDRSLVHFDVKECERGLKRGEYVPEPEVELMLAHDPLADAPAKVFGQAHSPYRADIRALEAMKKAGRPLRKVFRDGRSAAIDTRMLRARLEDEGEIPYGHGMSEVEVLNWENWRRRNGLPFAGGERLNKPALPPAPGEPDGEPLVARGGLGGNKANG